MKFSKPLALYVILIFVACFAIQSYWSTGLSFLKTLYNASVPFFVGAGIAYIVNILMSIYEKTLMRWVALKPIQKWKRPISMTFAYLTFILTIVWIFSIVIPGLISSLSSLTSIDTTVFTNFINGLNENKVFRQALDYLGSDAKLSETISNYSQQILQQVLSVLTNFLTSISTIASTIINLFVSLIFSIYVLANKEKLARQAQLLLETYLNRHQSKVMYVLDIMHQRFHSFFVSQTLEAIILGGLTTIGMILFKFPYAATVGILVGFTALIPVAGAYIGLTVGFVLIMTQSISQAFYFILFHIILQQIENNLIYPKVVGGSIGLPGMWVLLAITVGGAVSGVLGMLVAVPLAATAYQIIKDHVAYRQTLKE